MAHKKLNHTIHTIVITILAENLGLFKHYYNEINCFLAFHTLTTVVRIVKILVIHQ